MAALTRSPHVLDGRRAGLAAALGGSKSPSMAKALKPGVLAVLVDVEQLGQLVVVDDRAWAARSGGTTSAVGSSRLPSGPSVDGSEVTSSSRMASSGGLVTWANSWVK